MNKSQTVVSASASRRFFALFVLWGLAIMLVLVALVEPPSPLWQAFLIVLAAAVVFGAEALRKATLLQVELTEDGLVDSAGREIAPMDAITRVERGAFAFKPSNGFLVVLNRRVGPRVWAPGLWWRTGRRVGIGGVTAAHQAKLMAELIAVKLAERDGV